MLRMPLLLLVVVILLSGCRPHIGDVSGGPPDSGRVVSEHSPGMEPFASEGTPASEPADWYKIPFSAAMHVGPYSLTEKAIPILGDPVAVLGLGGLLKMSVTGDVPFYRRFNSGWGQWTGTAVHVQCGRKPQWAAISGPVPSLWCASDPGEPPQEDKIVLLHPGGRMSSYGIDVNLPVRALFLGIEGWMVGGGYRGELLWKATEGAEPPTVLGSGLVHLATGATEPFPPALMSGSGTAVNLYLSPDDTLYAVKNSDEMHGGVYRWLPREDRLTNLGDIPMSSSGIAAIGDDGVAWAVKYRPSSDRHHFVFERETPGDGGTQSWTLSGKPCGAGPGYVCVLHPLSGNSPASADLFFPLQHRKVHFGQLNPDGPVHVGGAILQRVGYNPAERMLVLDTFLGPKTILITSP